MDGVHGFVGVHQSVGYAIQQMRENLEVSFVVFRVFKLPNETATTFPVADPKKESVALPKWKKKKTGKNHFVTKIWAFEQK